MDKITRSINTLLNIIEDLSYQNRLLSGTVLQLEKGESLMAQVLVIHDIKDVFYNLSTYDCDYLIILAPGELPHGLDREELDVMSETGKLGEWVRYYWTDQSIAVLV